jgi:hypothetical protein
MIGSAALENLLQSLQAVSAMLELDASYGNPPPKETEILVEGLRGGAAVLIVGALEEYLRNAIEEHFLLLAETPGVTLLPNLPDKLWVTNVFQTLQRSLDGPKHATTEKKDRIPAIVKASRLIAQERIDPSALTYAQANPQASNLRALFKNLGFTDFFGQMNTDFMEGWGQQETTRFIEDKLDEIVNRRHRVAHTALALGIARSDLELSVRFIRVFGYCVDIHLKQHLRTVLGV